jgi:Dolichyl-phosphate-mannose-protein mannosyltransferase
MKETPAKRITELWLLQWIPWLVCTGLTVGFVAKPRSQGLHPDEFYWIGSAYYAHLAFGARDWSHQDWKLLPARENPPVAKYLIGAAVGMAGQPVSNPDLLACFYEMFRRLPGAWGEGEDQTRRAAVVARGSPEILDQVRGAESVNLSAGLLVPARVLMIICTVLTSLLVHRFALGFFRLPAALVASQVLLWHPAVTEASNLAMADAPALLTSCAAALAGIAWARGKPVSEVGSHPKVLWGGMAAGVLLGLACATKLNAGAVAIFLVVLGVLACFRPKRDDSRQEPGWKAWAMFCLSALAVFIAVNPALFRNPIDGMIALLNESHRAETIQARFLAGHLNEIGPKLGAIAHLLGFSWPGLVLLLLGALGGLRATSPALRLASGWWLVAFVAVVAWIPFSRSRYILPLVVPSALLAAGWLDVMLHRLRRRGVAAASG